MGAKTTSVPLTVIYPEANSVHVRALKYLLKKGTYCVLSPATSWLPGLSLHFMSTASSSKKPLLTLTFISHTGLPGLQSFIY